jgi:hypothetical protein
LRSLAESQQEFAIALLHPRERMPRGCVGPDRTPDERRFAVYRNNVAMSLIEALEDGYPVICRLLGEEYFRAVAHLYAMQHPPDSPVMLEYGGQFPEFLACFEPLASFAYLPDVARIERAWLESYHSAEATALDPAKLAAVPEHLTGAIRFRFHPSLRMVHSPYPAVTIWRMNVDGGDPVSVDLSSGAEEALIVRPSAEVHVRAMPLAAASLLQALAAGRSLAQAAAAVMCTHAQFDLAAHLAALFEGGLIIDYSIEPSED